MRVVLSKIKLSLSRRWTGSCTLYEADPLGTATPMRMSWREFPPATAPLLLLLCRVLLLLLSNSAFPLAQFVCETFNRVHQWYPWVNCNRAIWLGLRLLELDASSRWLSLLRTMGVRRRASSFLGRWLAKGLRMRPPLHLVELLFL